jgi:hypothetical protein
MADRPCHTRRPTGTSVWTYGDIILSCPDQHECRLRHSAPGQKLGQTARVGINQRGRAGYLQSIEQVWLKTPQIVAASQQNHAGQARRMPPHVRQKAAPGIDHLLHRVLYGQGLPFSHWSSGDQNRVLQVLGQAANATFAANWPHRSFATIDVFPGFAPIAARAHHLNRVLHGQNRVAGRQVCSGGPVFAITLQERIT